MRVRPLFLGNAELLERDTSLIVEGSSRSIKN